MEEIAKVATKPSSAFGIANLLCWQGKILLVFYTDYNRWQFRLLSEEGEVFGKQQTYKIAIDAPDGGERMGSRLLMRSRLSYSQKVQEHLRSANNAHKHPKQRGAAILERVRATSAALALFVRADFFRSNDCYDGKIPETSQTPTS